MRSHLDLLLRSETPWPTEPVRVTSNRSWSTSMYSRQCSTPTELLFVYFYIALISTKRGNFKPMLCSAEMPWSMGPHFPWEPSDALGISLQPYAGPAQLLPCSVPISDPVLALLLPQHPSWQKVEEGKEGRMRDRQGTALWAFQLYTAGLKLFSSTDSSLSPPCFLKTGKVGPSGITPQLQRTEGVC